MPNIKTVTAEINGQVYNLTLNPSSGKYEAAVTAPAKSSYPKDGHYYGVSITATDTASNQTTVDENDGTLGSVLRLTVKEKVKPAIVIESPAEGAVLTNNTPLVRVRVTDDDSGIDTSSFRLSIDSGAAVPWSAGTFEAVSGGYLWSYMPEAALSDGAHVLNAAVSDNDGNAADQAPVSVKVDTTPPSLDVTTPADNSWQNILKVLVTGTTNDATSSPVTVTIQAGSGTAVTAEVGSDGSFSKEVSLSEGENTIVITATDSAGKTSSVTRTVNVNTTAPRIQSVSIVPNPVNAGATYTITVEVV